MNIEKITAQHRRDFTAIYKCEHCGSEVSGAGYDDEHFHKYVIPDMTCISCGKKSANDYRPLATKYAADTVV